MASTPPTDLQHSGKRPGKSNVRPKIERLDRATRFGKVLDKAIANSPKSAPSQLMHAGLWAEGDFQKYKAAGKPYPFADPLNVLEYLSRQDADFDTLVAAALFPKYCPSAERELDLTGLAKTRSTFGRAVYALLFNAIRLEAFQLLPLKPGANQTPEEQLLQFRYGNLNIAESSGVVHIRGAYRYMELEERLREKGHRGLNRAAQDREIQEIRNVIADVSYRAGLEQLRYDLLDVCFRIEDPVRYERIATKTRGDASAQDLEEVSEILTRTVRQIVAQMFDLPEDEAEKFYELTINAKSVDESAKKSSIKRVPTAQLSDRHRFRVIINENLGMHPEFDYQKLGKKGRRAHLALSGKHIMAIYRAVSAKLGRDSEDPVIKEQFALRAALNPHKTVPGMDADLDDYISKPKDVGIEGGELGEFDFGYSGLNDRFALILQSGKVFMNEGQFTTRERFKNNKDHKQAGHINYKTGMLPDEVEGVFIYDGCNKIWKLPPEATARDYAEEVFKTDTGSRIPPGTRVIIDSKDKAGRRIGVPTGLTERLKTGDHARFTYG